MFYATIRRKTRLRAFEFRLTEHILPKVTQGNSTTHGHPLHDDTPAKLKAKNCGIFRIDSCYSGKEKT